MKTLLRHPRLYFLLIIFCFILIYGFIMWIHKYPIRYAANNTPNGYFFTGQASWFDPWDINVYVSAIKSGQENGLLLNNLYSSANDKPVLIYPIYTLTGAIFKTADPFILFHSMSFVTTFVLCLVIFLGTYWFTKNVWLSLLSIVLVIKGRGLGWLFPFSPDINVSSFTFRTAVQRPHEGVGLILYIVSMASFFKYLLSNQLRYSLISFASLLLNIFFYPYYLLIYATVFFIFLAARHVKVTFSHWRNFILNISIVGCLSVIYYIYLHSSSFTSAISENAVKIPILDLLVGYGFLVPVLCYSFIKLKDRRPYRLFLILWFSFAIIESYLPIGFSRFYLRGLFFPLVLVTLFEINLALKSKKFQAIWIFFSIIIISGVLTSSFVFVKRIDEVDQYNAFYYLPHQYQTTFKYLALLPKDGVMANPVTANFIPAYTGKKVYAGHLLQTPGIEDKMSRLPKIYSGLPTPEDAVKYLKEQNVSYVLYGYFERDVGYTDPTYLELIYFNNLVKIYSVN